MGKQQCTNGGWVDRGFTDRTLRRLRGRSGTRRPLS
jgi:hypothetical protein